MIITDLYGEVLFSTEKDTLSGADLTRAKLRGADLTGANLSGTNLAGADLTGANLSGLPIKYNYNLPYRIIFHNDIIFIGCKKYTRDQWEAFSDEEISKMDLGALTFWKAHKENILEISRSVTKN